ncbi:hypothetical protein F5B21DRAFT_497460 [Xylaria acuta]|nr:hypothetical protein F5B21DRAFT_497460 [Xylaria acuta]
MSSNPRKSRATNNQRPVHSYGLAPVPTLQDHIHAIFFTPPPRDSRPYQHSLSADLLEIRIVLPSVSYLRANEGQHFGSVPLDILKAYTDRAITDRSHHRAAFASPADINPRVSAWWMAGDILRTVGNSLDNEVIAWWDSAPMLARGSCYSQTSSTIQSAPYSVCSSDRFSLSFRTFNDGDIGLEEVTTRYSVSDWLAQGSNQRSSKEASSPTCELW